MNTEDWTVIDPTAPQAAGSPPFEADKYLEHFDDLAMTEGEKVAFLRVLWDIMAAFVRLGFGVDSVLPSLFQNASANATNAVEQIPTHEFNVAVNDGAPEEEE